MMLTIPDDVFIKDTKQQYLMKCRTKKVTGPDYLAIVADFMKFIIEQVFMGHTVTLPNRCGDMCIVGKRIDLSLIDPDNLAASPFKPDWKKTKELWAVNPQAKADKKLIYLLNEGTSSILYKFQWNTFLSKLQNANFYKFTLSRQNKVDLSQIIRDGQEYFVLEKFYPTPKRKVNGS